MPRVHKEYPNPNPHPHPNPRTYPTKRLYSSYRYTDHCRYPVPAWGDAACASVRERRARREGMYIDYPSDTAAEGEAGGGAAAMVCGVDGDVSSRAVEQSGTDGSSMLHCCIAAWRRRRAGSGEHPWETSKLASASSKPDSSPFPTQHAHGLQSGLPPPLWSLWPLPHLL